MFVRATAIAVVGVLVLTACERPDDDATNSTTDSGTVAATTTTTTAGDVSDSTSIAPSTTAPDVTAASTTPPTTSANSEPPTTPPTTSPPTTQPNPTSPADLVLAFDGVEPYLFGTPDDEVVAALGALLGDPISDDSDEYPSPEDGMFLTGDGSEAFVFPFGRTVCFANGLCTQFGAGAGTALLFTGWDFSGTDAAGLATEDGITIGSTWADHLDSIEVEVGGCFQEGYGNASGVQVVLLSGGDPFIATDDEGNQTAQVPDAADVSVTALRAGEVPYSPDADC